MLIETKFEVGQNVFALRSGNVEEFKVIEIKVHLMENKTEIWSQIMYKASSLQHVSYIADFSEDKLYVIKEEAIIEWLSKQNVDMLIIKGKL